MSCRSVRDWLHLASESLHEPERLALEEHLQVCARCRDDRAQLSFVRDVVGELPASSIGPRGHTRAIAGALMRGPTSAPAATVPRWWMVAIGASGFAAAAVVAIVVQRDRSSAPQVAAPLPASSSLRDFEPPTTPPPPMPGTAPELVVLEGSLDGVPAGGQIPTNLRMRTRSRTRISIHGQQVTIGASSELVVRTDRSILLEHGSADVEGTVTITTPRYTVLSAGTVAIGPDAVQVTRGSARIAHGGKEIQLEMGETWKVPEPSPRIRAADALSRAHAAYRDGAFADAQRHAAAALTASPTRPQAAEAQTIIADCMLATGNTADAAERYEAIATEYANLATGETALFTAARLTAKAGRTEAARTLFARYLARYPRGQFADDARRASNEGAR